MEVLYTSEQTKVAVEEGIQTKKIQQISRLYEETDELWHLMQRCKRNNDSEIQTVIWMTVEDWEVHYKINEQQQLQNKFWDPSILQLEYYDLEIIFLFPWEFDASACSSPFQIPISMLDQS